MKLFLGPRGSGKTRELIEFCRENPDVILLVASYKESLEIEKALGFDDGVNHVYCYAEARIGDLRDDKTKGVAIDDIDRFVADRIKLPLVAMSLRDDSEEGATSKTTETPEATEKRGPLVLEDVDFVITKAHGLTRMKAPIDLRDMKEGDKVAIAINAHVEAVDEFKHELESRQLRLSREYLEVSTVSDDWKVYELAIQPSIVDRILAQEDTRVRADTTFIEEAILAALPKDDGSE